MSSAFIDFNAWKVSCWINDIHWINGFKRNLLNKIFIIFCSRGYNELISRQFFIMQRFKMETVNIIYTIYIYIGVSKAVKKILLQNNLIK